MTEPTPRAVAPSDVRRAELVQEVMAGLENLDDLPLEQQAAKLGEAQTILAGVLSNDPAVTQLGLPGVSR